MSLNRWVFKWRLKVRMFSHSRMSAGREFQLDGAATEKARRASLVCMRGTTSIGASEERRARGGARVTLITKSDQIGVNRTKSEIPITKSGPYF